MTPKSTGRSLASRPHKTAAESKSPRKAGAKDAAVLLSGGDRRIPRTDGEAPLRAYIAAMPGGQRHLGRRLDALIVRNVPR